MDLYPCYPNVLLMTSYEDVRKAKSHLSIDEVTHSIEDETVEILGKTTCGLQLTYRFELRVTVTDKIRISHDTVYLIGPEREDEPEIIEIAYSSDVPPNVRDRFTNYTDRNFESLVQFFR